MIEDDFEEDCPIIPHLLSLLMIPRPFGMGWEQQKVERFLERRGYQILHRWNEDEEEDYSVAVKGNELCVPTEENIIKVFVGEVQDILLDWLVKNGSTNTGEVEGSN